MRKIVLAIWMVITICVAITYAAIQGDFVINGVDATTSTKFYRIPATIVNGLRVDVTRVSAGTKTPSDAFTNPTDAITAWSLIGVWNGATWNRWAGVANNADDVAVITTNVIPQVVTYPMMFDGTTEDRVRGNSTDGMQVYLGRVSSAVVTMFTGTTVATTISAASATRRMVLIYNEGTDICYIKLGSGVTTTSYSFKMVSGTYWEMPNVTYSGIITAIWSAGTNTTIVTSY